MNSRYFGVVFLLILLIAGLGGNAWAEEEKKAVLSITPALTFAWYPLSYFSEREGSTYTEGGINNIGISVLMGLRLFDKVGAQLNLKIDDPTFQKMVDFAGLISAYGFALNFDYHSFNEKVTWKGSTPDPMQGNPFQYHSRWNGISLLYNISQFFEKEEAFFIALGVTYCTLETPLEYRVKQGGGLSNPGFGLVKGNFWGIGYIIDMATGAMNLSQEERKRNNLYSIFPNMGLWMLLEGYVGFAPKLKTDDDAIAWMSVANGGKFVDGNIDNSFSLGYSKKNEDDSGGPFSIMKVSCIMGLQKIWDISKKARVGFAAGVECRVEEFNSSGSDIEVCFNSLNIGPVVRLSARW